mgnify:CR=1 FL=1
MTLAVIVMNGCLLMPKMIPNANGCSFREFTLTIGRSQHSDEMKTAHAFLCMGCQVQIRLRVSGNHRLPDVLGFVAILLAGLRMKTFGSSTTKAVLQRLPSFALQTL